MCQLKKFPSLYTPKTTWIILGWYTSWSHDVEGYTQGDCSLEDLIAVPSGSLAVNPTVGYEEFDLEMSPTVSGFTPAQLNDLYKSLVTEMEGQRFFVKQRNFHDAYAGGYGFPCIRPCFGLFIYHRIQMNRGLSTLNSECYLQPTG